jgi:cold-inducible RNA-binding protein
MEKKLFVGNISWDATEEMLKDLFATIGDTEEVALIKDRNYPDRHKGFAFVTMATEELAQKAIDELNEKDLAGRAITVSEAKPKKEY